VCKSSTPLASFTHVDPFEDTESSWEWCDAVLDQVSPTSIRSRILKGGTSSGRFTWLIRFTHVDPFEDTESPIRGLQRLGCNLFHPRRSVRGY